MVGREPVMSGAVAVVAATIALLVAFKVHITPDQREAIEGWCLAILSLGLGIRSKVSPVGTD